MASQRQRASAQVALTPAGRPPFRFQIAYDGTAIQPGRSYDARATIKAQNRLMSTTDRAYPVFAGVDAARFPRYAGIG